MALLGPDDDVVARLGREPRRIAVAGVSGVGKTTLAPVSPSSDGDPRTAKALQSPLETIEEVERWLATLPTVGDA